MWPIKNFEKFFMAYLYMPKIFHDPHKNPPPPPPTYLMYVLKSQTVATLLVLFKKDLALPFSLAKKRIYLDSQLLKISRMFIMNTFIIGYLL